MSNERIESLLALSYAESMKFFARPFSRSLIPEYIDEIRKRKTVTVQDFAGKHDSKERLSQILNECREGTFILIDGESAVGKSTFAKKVCAKWGYILYDVDERGEKVNTKNCMSFNEFDKKVDDFLYEIAEETILRESEGGAKTVVMVGAFRGIITRTIIVNTLASHFRKSVSIILHDKVDANIMRAHSRDKRYVNEQKGVSPEKRKFILKLLNIHSRQLAEETHY